MPPAAIATLGAAGIALLGILITLLINGARTERQRRRDLHARALAAITTYGEMPYRIRRRPPGAESRARLSDDLSRIKAELDTCQVLLAADGDERLSNRFDKLYAVARTTVGKAAHEAWNAQPIQTDNEMNQGELYRTLRPFNAARHQFADNLRTATLPRRKRVSRWLRCSRVAAKLPWMRRPRPAEERISEAPQDLAMTSRAILPAVSASRTAHAGARRP
jgi:hypothetical protein